MRVGSLGFGLLLLVIGCASTKSYVYEPAVQANAQANGYPAAYLPIPTAQPTGDVRIASFGVTDIQADGGGPKTPALQVRMIVSNNQDQAAWSLDTREIVVALGAEGTSRPAVVNADSGQPPVLQVPPGEKVTIDLYYPLPPSMNSAERLPGFDVLWEVKTGSGAVVQRTPFEREQVEPQYVYGPYPYGYPYYYGPYGPYPNYYGPYGFSIGFGVGLGPYWWYDGGYPYYGFRHHPGVIVGPGHPPYGRIYVAPHAGYWHYPGHGANGVGGSGSHGGGGHGHRGH